MFQEAPSGRAAAPAVRGLRDPDGDWTLAAEGKHVMSMLPQWVPESWSEEPHREGGEAFADRLIQRWKLFGAGVREPDGPRKGTARIDRLEG